MKVLVLSDISIDNGKQIANWELRSEVNSSHKWDWPSRQISTTQSMKVWRDSIRGTFMKGINEILVPTAPSGNLQYFIVYPLFSYSSMNRKHSLMETIS